MGFAGGEELIYDSKSVSKDYNGRRTAQIIERAGRETHPQ
jgi:hypothetical protein